MGKIADEIRAMLGSKQAADEIGVRERTLRYWRERKVGPPYYTMVGRIYYDVEDLRIWHAQNRKNTL
jgi:DNA-binding transcriptional MerR regulator